MSVGDLWPRVVGSWSPIPIPAWVIVGVQALVIFSAVTRAALYFDGDSTASQQLTGFETQVPTVLWGIGFAGGAAVIVVGMLIRQSWPIAVGNYLVASLNIALIFPFFSAAFDQSGLGAGLRAASGPIVGGGIAALLGVGTLIRHITIQEVERERQKHRAAADE